jgi:hypothetical protein
MRISQWVTACLALVLAASLGACTSDDKDSDASEPTSTEPATSLTRPDAKFTVVVRRMEHVKPADRGRVKAAIAAPIQDWFNGAFVEGEYPRNTYDAGLKAWTRDAAVMAARDRDTTTNAALGSDVVAVVADQQSANLYVFANKGVSGGATARVRLRLTEEKPTGELVRIAVTGSVYLTRDKSQWKIFGYDLERKVVPA